MEMLFTIQYTFQDFFTDTIDLALIFKTLRNINTRYRGRQELGFTVGENLGCLGEGLRSPLMTNG